MEGYSALRRRSTARLGIGGAFGDTGGVRQTRNDCWSIKKHLLYFWAPGETTVPVPTSVRDLRLSKLERVRRTELRTQAGSGRLILCWRGGATVCGRLAECAVDEFGVEKL